VQSDPIGHKAGPNFYNYSDSNPLRLLDHLGLFSMENPNCDECDDEAENRLRDAIQQECNRLSATIKNRRLKKCIQHRCNSSGVVRIFCNCRGQDREYGRYGCAFGGTIILCFKWRDQKNGSDRLAEAAIHEWAHSCNWIHGDGMGVPNDPGPDEFNRRCIPGEPVGTPSEGSF